FCVFAVLSRATILALFSYTTLFRSESRLDNVVYRAGFAGTRRQARQLVVHGHFLVNGQRVNIPSYRVKAHDIIDVAEKSLTLHRSEEHTSELQSREKLVCRLLPEKK